MSDEEDWPLIDVQADPDAHRDDVVSCLMDHLDDGDVRVTSIGRGPRSIIAVCEQCEVKYWFEEVPEEAIPGGDEA
jgi:hypothetical protein